MQTAQTLWRSCKIYTQWSSLLTIHVVTNFFPTGGVQLKLHCLPSLYEYTTHKRTQIGLKTDTISNLVPKIYRQAMKSAESAKWQEALMLNFNPCRQMMFEHLNSEHYPRTTYRCTQSKTMFRYLLIFPPRRKCLSRLVPCFVVLRSYFTMIP